MDDIRFKLEVLEGFDCFLCGGRLGLGGRGDEEKVIRGIS